MQKVKLSLNLFPRIPNNLAIIMNGYLIEMPVERLSGVGETLRTVTVGDEERGYRRRGLMVRRRPHEAKYNDGQENGKSGQRKELYQAYHIPPHHRETVMSRARRYSQKLAAGHRLDELPT